MFGGSARRKIKKQTTMNREDIIRLGEDSARQQADKSPFMNHIDSFAEYTAMEYMPKDSKRSLIIIASEQFDDDQAVASGIIYGSKKACVLAVCNSIKEPEAPFGELHEAVRRMLKEEGDEKPSDHIAMVRSMKQKKDKLRGLYVSLGVMCLWMLAIPALGLWAGVHWTVSVTNGLFTAFCLFLMAHTILATRRELKREWAQWEAVCRKHLVESGVRDTMDKIRKDIETRMQRMKDDDEEEE